MYNKKGPVSRSYTICAFASSSNSSQPYPTTTPTASSETPSAPMHHTSPQMHHSPKKCNTRDAKCNTPLPKCITALLKCFNCIKKESQPQIKTPPMGRCFNLNNLRWDRTGAGVNDMPGACQSRDPACSAEQVDPLQVHHSIRNAVQQGGVSYCLFF